MNLSLHFMCFGDFFGFFSGAGFLFCSMTPFCLSPFVFTSKLCSPVKHHLWQETSWISCPGRSSWWRILRRSALRTWETSPLLLMVRNSSGAFLLTRICLGMCVCWNNHCAELSSSGGDDATVVRAGSGSPGDAAVNTARHMSPTSVLTLVSRILQVRRERTAYPAEDGQM